jgi:hypothetical protein
MSSKKRRSESPVKGMKSSCLTHYAFRTEMYASVVPWPRLLGCQTIVRTLEREIRTVILNESLYETTLGGRMPVNRFLRFFGVKSSSKETAVLSFAADAKIDVFLVRTPTGFEPQKHLSQIYRQAKEAHTPVIIVLKNLDILFRHDPDASSGDNYKRSVNMYALADELAQIRAGNWKIWTIVLTTLNSPLPFDIDEFFQSSTEWAGLPEIGDIFDAKTRARMLLECLRKYIPDTGSFPFDHNAAATLNFANEYTQYCTYKQIDEFVRSVVNRWKFQIPSEELLLVDQHDTRLIPTTKDFTGAVRGRETISQYPPLEGNVARFISIN